ncbi:hypothetical protein Egran_04681 [Elaphomyces granulatus]|uniref:Uncharacterized protein n=1 Tax=Elaphomyces granulatus TaxID=519963 RepID=A0A232LTZ3_9EURO|nr:hypothetical protein Egran_04681 [Elaphomyces granulatus]
MLDENLPTFLLKSNGQQSHSSTFFLSQYGDEPVPTYLLRHLDPAAPSSKNCYAVALYDAHVPDVLFGEVMISPEWTQTSQDSSNRQSTAVPPPPEPILPSQFTIQLYNPDHQIVVRHKPKAWNSPPAWEFEMPQQTFRQPSTSTLDRSQSDPAVLNATPKLKFSWRKDGTLSKDFACYLSDKTTAPDDRKKSKEPDITVAIFTGFKELTLYEPNLSRVEIEDFKGLEIVLMLSATVIRDVFFRQLKDTFHISDLPTVAPTPGGRKSSGRKSSPTAVLAASPVQPLRNEPPAGGKPPPKPQRAQNTSPKRETQPPPLDPRTQWEIDAERARLRKQQEAEARERKKLEQEQERKTRKLLEAEERAARKKQAEIDKETERLKKIYGSEEQQYQTQPPAKANPQPRPQSHLNVPTSFTGRQSRTSASQPRPQSYQSPSSNSAPQLKEKKSFFGFRLTPAGEGKLNKQKSVMF